MIKIETFVFNLFAVNTFVVWDEETKEAAVIDPGTSGLAEEELLDDYINKNDLKIKFLINLLKRLVFIVMALNYRLRSI